MERNFDLIKLETHGLQGQDALDLGDYEASEESEDELPEIIWADTAKIEVKDGANYLNEILKIGPTIGTGAFCKVKKVSRRVQWEEDGVQKDEIFDYALKIFDKDKLAKSTIVDPIMQNEKHKTYLDNVYDEIMILSKLKHPNIARLYEIIDDNETNTLYTVIEYCEYGQIMHWNPETRRYSIDPKFFDELKEELKVRSLVEKAVDITDQEFVAREVFKQVARGLDYLHNKKNVAHRDLKGENILAKKDEGKFQVKVIDFSISEHLGESDSKSFTDISGTPEFLAPETSTMEGYTLKPTDIWAYGLCLFSFVFGNLPFDDPSAVAEGIYNLEIPTSVKISEKLRDLIAKTLDPTPAKRIVIADVLSHPWFSD